MARLWVVTPHHDRLPSTDPISAPRVTRPGLGDGLCGIALVLDALGLREDALDALSLAFDHPLDPDDLSVFSGTAGIGLTLLHFEAATGEPRYLELAVELAEHSATKLRETDGWPMAEGLLRGRDGVVAFLWRVHERTGDATLADAAQLDLATCA